MEGWLILLVVAAVIEYGTWRVTGLTLSQHLWAFQKTHPWFRWVVFISGFMLTTHLAFGWP